MRRCDDVRGWRTGLFAGANIGVDYKHVFFGSYTTSSLGTVATRQVDARISPDMDLVTLRLGVPLR